MDAAGVDSTPQLLPTEAPTIQSNETAHQESHDADAIDKDQQEPPQKRPCPDLWMGRYGKAQLLRHLSEAPDVVEALQQAQQDHGIPEDPTCHPAFPLLHLLGVDRGKVCGELHAFLHQRLLQTIPTLCRPKLLALLPEVFPYVRQPFACDVLAAICTSRHLAQVPPAYLHALSSDAAVFSCLPLPVKRKVWEVDMLRWKQDVLRWLKTYTATAAAQAPGVLVALVTGSPPSWRCAGDTVAELIHATGSSTVLLTETIRMLRELWSKYHHAEAGQFLHQLLLETAAVHPDMVDSKVQKVATATDTMICSADRDGRVVRDLVSAALALRGEDPAAPQIGLILGHPITVASLCHQALLRCAPDGQPEGDDVVQSVNRLLAVGCPAGANKSTSGIGLGRQLLASRLYTQLSRFAILKVEPGTGKSGAPIAPHDGTSTSIDLDQRIKCVLRSNPLAQSLLLFRCLQLAHSGEAAGLATLLDVVVDLGDERLGMEDAWLEALSLLALGSPLQAEVAGVLLRQLFRRIPHIEAATQACHVLVKGLAEAMPTSDLEALLNTCGMEFPNLLDDDEGTLSSATASVIG